MKTLFCMVSVALILILLSACISDAEAREWEVTAKERSTGKYAKCVSQTINDKRMIICSEGNFALGTPVPIGQKPPLPVTVTKTIKKSTVAPKKPPTTREMSPFELLLRGGAIK